MSDDPRCVCGHLKSEHGAGGYCHATVRVRSCLPRRRRSCLPPGLGHCKCPGFSAAEAGDEKRGK
jgi:hypothetical protein